MMAERDFIDGAKERIGEEFEKSTSGVRGYVESFVSSRIAMALSLVLFIAFSCTAVYAPSRLAPLTALNLASFGVVPQGPTLDLSTFDVTAEQQRQQAQGFVADAAPYVANAYASAKAAFPPLPRAINTLGALAALAALAYTMKIQVRAAGTATRSPAL